MNRKGILRVFIVFLLILLPTQAMATDPFFPFSPFFTEQELDNLLAPVALYPDPLLAQMLPAATYPGEIAEVAEWLRGGGAISGVDRQSWDESVKAIARYPGILNMMADNMDWTVDVGDAFLNQPEDVARSIQRLRWQARRAGNLESTAQHTVMIAGDYIEIIPAHPQYIYIPQYDPSVVYVRRWVPGGVPFISFGLGLTIGGWLTLDFDWVHHHVMYHGWNRPGWVNHARPHVRMKNVYVQRSRPFIRQTWRHDASHGSPERYRALHPGGGPKAGRYTRIPEIRGGVKAPPKPSPQVFGPRGDTSSLSNRGRESRKVLLSPHTKPSQGIGKQPAPSPPPVRKPKVPTMQEIKKPQAPVSPGISRDTARPIPRIGKASPAPRPAEKSVQPPRIPSVTFGGYRGNSEAKSQSLRGKASRKSSAMTRPSTPASKGRDPAGKGNVRGTTPAGRGDIRGKMRQ